ncbi:MAG: hypothetical protein IPG92_16765 [Flavobacteriales bacterium]|nr:hypothetical protein [Flavobacteriales bacterium]
MMLVGCKKEETGEPDLGLGYFPNVIGSWIEYQVDSIGRDDEAGVHDTVSYRLKEKVVEAYYDPQGRLAYRIHRMVRNADNLWVVRDVWTRTVSTSAAETTEENLRRLKISFPVAQGRAWDMNVYNVEDELELTHREIGIAYTVNGLAFDKTTLVEATFESNFVDTLIFQERYAEGVGMISKRVQDTNTQFPSNVLRTKGVYFTMSIVAFGNE